ncbi:anthranilate synthase component II [Labilibaculum euxinus]|uniref:Aminodeoxychorismate/anthranilate synthase component II n=1 Tax=Labilibaculum euxinus TaxID=2686357 RepID=A0A7M4D8G5_9BACT|nr:aminodeoxychorismate/anthranilate synthase component II [Labilibaculum euxinus]MUP38944.1 aminodeoxychorismate/anthranilate synthase component II [Labilibaculum euxinus]MVB08149.1 aminodeoxychorismate/anthranilate synthase component II [Labilibaculum euxinus]
MKILVLDNYDSFTYNLVEYLRKLGAKDIEVHRNREIDLKEVAKFDKILLSPGPGIPDEAGILKDVIREYAATKSILGICLGEQAIAEVFGGSIENLDKVYHGVATLVFRTDDNKGVLQGIDQEFTAGRYHSWNVTKENLPDCLLVTCEDAEGQIMGIRHKEYDVQGVQFHPESVLTPNGLKMIENWLNS